MSFAFDKDKTINATLFVIESLKKLDIEADFHKVFKILYFADQKHLARYGRPILGDRYIAMENGPVPSNLYDIFKVVKGNSIFSNQDNFQDFFEIYNNYYLKNKKIPQLDYLSKSDIEILIKSIDENSALSFNQLTDKSHDKAWESANIVDNSMDYHAIASVCEIDEDMQNYIALKIENQQFADMLQ
ncbi:MAG: Panacea domain-containing protein [Campylobacterota bacterium]|nr:Panacea domain-containing protein [Campylobacterota bacterium]